MIPAGENLSFEMESIPDKTYRLDWDNKTINGNVDGVDAKRQAVAKILMTEAENFLIYDPSYGRIFEDLFGAADVEEEVKDRIATAILNDDRFSSVSFEDAIRSGNSLEIPLTVTTNENEEISTEVTVSV